MSALSLSDALALAEILPAYAQLRREHPEVPAKTIHAYVRNDCGISFREFCCPGHRWVYTGTAYGGDDESYRGEGRVYCRRCGADGDA